MGKDASDDSTQSPKPKNNVALTTMAPESSGSSVGLLAVEYGDVWGIWGFIIRMKWLTGLFMGFERLARCLAQRT